MQERSGNPEKSNRRGDFRPGSFQQGERQQNVRQTFHKEQRRNDPTFSTPKPGKENDWNEPQKAVGGIQEVDALLKNHPGLVHRVLFRKDSGDKRLYELQKKVKHLHIHHQQLDADLLDAQTQPNQGVVALCHEREVSSWMTVRQNLFAALEQGTPKTVVVITNLEDPRN
ncbi:MAG TPA: RNA methyltransferase substrate-binding domain-containing protein, partial [Fibrobacteraceae bacterium]|nr:RNA methyltransferase substrate-binding domain-containing protein [Fibrobacteraceae bacterium]